MKRIQKNHVFNLKEESRKFDGKVLFLTVLITPFLGNLIEYLGEILLPPAPESLTSLFADWVQPTFVSFVSMAVAPAILEELLFRGVILEGMLQEYSPRKAIIWSAVLFGVVHLNPWQAFGAIIIGLLIGWLYYKTRSVLPGILLHFVNNSLAFFLMLHFGIEANTSDIIGNPLVYYLLLAVSVVIFVGILWYLVQVLKQKPNPALGEVAHP
ncbi:CPBP family intramembrane glutamic endopeptidase [Sabulibacter ruber]|uniref:CPBP family intramembrane glutamic endopeptidase n=1 Tax=Sabulibacter ruber TaxID=2811901 RepID=UPI001A95699A|nr:CPBP family intramembrane glutamic endopeptidase [Sabulibacter ruber]